MLVLKKTRGGWHTARVRQNLREVTKLIPMQTAASTKATKAGLDPQRWRQYIRLAVLLFNRPEVRQLHFARVYWSGTFTWGSSARTEACNCAGSTFLRCAHSTRLAGR